MEETGQELEEAIPLDHKLPGPAGIVRFQVNLFEDGAGKGAVVQHVRRFRVVGKGGRSGFASDSGPPAGTLDYHV